MIRMTLGDQVETSKYLDVLELISINYLFDNLSVCQEITLQGLNRNNRDAFILANQLQLKQTNRHI